MKQVRKSSPENHFVLSAIFGQMELCISLESGERDLSSCKIVNLYSHFARSYWQVFFVLSPKLLTSYEPGCSMSISANESCWWAKN